MISVLGSVNMDFTTIATRLPKPGETVLGHGFSRAAGGKGANQALAARRAGAAVRLVGRIGDDPEGVEATALLREAGVDLSLLKVAGARTGTAHISVSLAGENSIVVVPGANHCVDLSTATATLAGLSRGDTLLLQCEIPAAAIERALSEASRRGITSVLNLAPMTAEAIPLGRLADIVVANETEFDLYCGTVCVSASDREARMLAMADRTGQTVVVTLGSEGVVGVKSGSVVKAGSLPINPVDTVGAGDTFCGFLVAGLASGYGFEDAIRRAAIAGSLACLKSGAQPSIPSLADVIGRS